MSLQKDRILPTDHDYDDDVSTRNEATKFRGTSIYYPLRARTGNPVPIFNTENSSAEEEVKAESFDLFEIQKAWKRRPSELGSGAVHTVRTEKYQELLQVVSADENQGLAQAFVFHLAANSDIPFSTYGTLFPYTPQEVEDLLESGQVGDQKIVKTVVKDNPLDRRRKVYREFAQLVGKEPSLVAAFIRDVILYSGAEFSLQMLAAFGRPEDIHEIYSIRHPQEARAYKDKKATQEISHEPEVVVYPTPLPMAAA